MNPLDIAAKQIGLNERDQRTAIQDYLSTGGVNLDPATTAWCAAFVNSTLKQSGMEGTGSNLARSYMNWGEAVDTPQRGDVAVFSRGDPNGPYGHVGFFEGFNPDGTIKVLGGNQGDSVSYASYGKDRLLGFRRAPGQSQPNALAGAAPQPRPNGLAQPNALAERPQFQLASNQIDPRDFQMPISPLSFTPVGV